MQLMPDFTSTSQILQNPSQLCLNLQDLMWESDLNFQVAFTKSEYIDSWEWTLALDPEFQQSVGTTFRR